MCPPPRTKCEKTAARQNRRLRRYLDDIFTTPPSPPSEEGRACGQACGGWRGFICRGVRVAEGDLKWATPLGPCAPGFDH